MITIRPLTSLPAGALDAMGGGYTSPARYVVRKTENAARTVIAIEMETLPFAYVKHWQYDDAAENQRYQEYVRQGYSLGAYHGGRLAALAINEARTWNGTLWIWEFHVAPAYHRQGVGRALMEAVIQLARHAGFRVVGLETQNTNVPAISFYRALGFELDGLDLSLYTNTDMVDGEVAFFMKRKL